jgi:hypothetical protein
LRTSTILCEPERPLYVDFASRVAAASAPAGAKLGQDLDAFSTARYPQEQLAPLRAAVAALVPNATFAVSNTLTALGESALRTVFSIDAFLVQKTLFACMMSLNISDIYKHFPGRGTSWLRLWHPWNALITWGDHSCTSGVHGLVTYASSRASGNFSVWC